MRRHRLLTGILLLLTLVPGLSAGPSQSHKIQTSDPALEKQILAKGGRLVADYGGYQLLETDQWDETLATRAELRDHYNSIHLNAVPLDTSLPQTRALRKSVGTFDGKRLHLVQFAGPDQPAWHRDLLATGVQIVDYIPENTWLVYGDAASLAHLQTMAAAAPHIQWEGAYEDNYKIHPSALSTDKKGRPRNIGTDSFAVQLVGDAAANAETLKLLDTLKLEPFRRSHVVMHYYNVVARFSPGDLARIAAQPDVISIQPYFTPKKVCERQDQIVAGNLSGNVPSGPGYMAWLTGKGFTQAQFTASGFVVDMSDSGIDDGTTSPNHFGLWTGGAVGGTSRVIYNRLEGTPNSPSTLKGCDGHGTLNTHIVGGYDNSSGFPFADNSGYHYGLGVCPFVGLGSSVVFDPDNWTSPDYTQLQSDAYNNGARICNNSWGDSGSSGSYTIDSQEYDALVRDAEPAGSSHSTSGNQEMVIVFAAGNDGPGASTLDSPGTAKNVISVGAGQNVQSFGGSDGCSITDVDASSANEIIYFSSRGPCSDGRAKPDISAPGTHVSGGVIQTATPGANGTADSCFTAGGVCGGVGNNFFPAGQQFYTASSGTSHSTPCVSGGCALLRQYFINNFTNPPSPAMTKGYLMNSARYMTGSSANDTLPSPNQGMGEMNLGTAFDGVARILRDELPGDLFTASGQFRRINGLISDPTKPFRVTVAWTDAPGSTSSGAWNNNLDLVVTVGGNTYKGNVFNGANSTTGGSADSVNNVESVFLPAGITGSFSAQVIATSINSVGVPNSNNALEQDFALVVYNATGNETAAIIGAGASLAQEGCTPTNGVIDPGETVTVNFSLQDVGGANTTNLVATLLATNGVIEPGATQNYGALTSGGAAVTRPFSFTASGPCGGTIIPTLQLQDGTLNLGTVSYNFLLGKFTPDTSFTQNFDSVTPPALPSLWQTSSSGTQSPWVTTNQVSDTVPDSAFAGASTNVGVAELDSPVIPIQTTLAQLTFRNQFNLEADPNISNEGFDGGVLEIKIGSGTYTDILTAGGTFITGGYTRTITATEGSGNNPLAGRPAWSGNSGGFITTTAALPAAAAGQNVQFRWLCGTDAGNGFTSIGWWVDSISISDGSFACCSSLEAPTIFNPRISAGTIIFSFQTVNLQTYVVESTSAFPVSSWTQLQHITGDGTIQSVTNNISEARAYYRIRSP